MIVVRYHDRIRLRIRLVDGTEIVTHKWAYDSSIFPVLNECRMQLSAAFSAEILCIVVSTSQGTFYYRWSEYAQKFINYTNNTAKHVEMHNKFSRACKEQTLLMSNDGKLPW